MGMSRNVMLQAYDGLAKLVNKNVVNCRNGFCKIFKNLKPKPTVQEHKVHNYISKTCEKMVVYWHPLNRNCRVYCIHA
jgi:hypothetical protein